MAPIRSVGEAVRVVVIGSGGLLGTAFRNAVREFPEITEVLLPGRRELDVTEQVQVERYLESNRPDVVINAAALMPADLCERHPEVAYGIHALGARWVSRACARIGALPIYISTDFVFDGIAGSPYSPDSATSPLLTYGVTKLAGEQETRLGCPRHIVARTAALFGPTPRSASARPCFINRILDMAHAGKPLSVVDSIVMSPTYTVDLARMTLALALDEVEAGIYHVVNSGRATWYELAEAAVELAGFRVPISRAQPQQHVEAPRPASTPLVGELPGRAGKLQRPWRSALAEYVGQPAATPLLVPN
ncbi:NAD(P)-dependent oxidoreductase [Streptomyces sp. NPDC002088]|uniref:SDR family oxidoreductase n=1 Tax=unclassified Streptomyces TaxID=2593676 RepID=UPI00332517B7